MTRIRLRHKVAVAVCSVLVAFGGLEVAARAYARFAGQERVLIHDDVLGWRLVPGARHRYMSEDGPYVVEMNSRGLRDREYPYEKPARTFRILFLGDSFTFGSAARQDEIFTERLEASVRGLEVINAGVPGYSLDQELLYLESEGYRYQPDLVILGVVTNDLETFLGFNPSIRRRKGYAALENGELRFHPPSFGTLSRLMQPSYVLSWAGQRAGVEVDPRDAARPLDPSTQREALLRLLERMRDFSTRSGAEFAAMYIPLLTQNERHLLQDVLGDLTQQKGVPVLDLQTLLKRDPHPGSYYFRQDIHFNAAGHARTAELLRQFLLERTSLADARD